MFGKARRVILSSSGAFFSNYCLVGEVVLYSSEWGLHTCLVSKVPYRMCIEQWDGSEC